MGDQELEVTEPPIVIVSIGRSGSSLLAMLLAKHGVWVGEVSGSDRNNPYGYYENLPINRKIRSIDPTEPVILPPQAWWRQWVHAQIIRQGYAGGKWLVKHATHFWHLWDGMDPIFLLPRRDPELVFRSHRKARFNNRYDDVELRRRLWLLWEEADTIRDGHGGIDIDMPAVIDGDLRTLSEAFDACGVELDPMIVRETVDPSCWHFR